MLLGVLPENLRSDLATGPADVKLEQPSSPLYLGKSYLPEIKAKIQAAIFTAEATKIIGINLGLGESWWSTRLHLLAALLADYTTVAQIAFTDEGAGYLGMCPPADVRRNLSSFFPDIEIAYRNSLPLAAGPNGHKSTKQASALAAAPTPASNMRVQAGIPSYLHKSLIRRYL